MSVPTLCCIVCTGTRYMFICGACEKSCTVVQSSIPRCTSIVDTDGGQASTALPKHSFAISTCFCFGPPLPLWQESQSRFKHFKGFWLLPVAKRTCPEEEETIFFVLLEALAFLPSNDFSPYAGARHATIWWTFGSVFGFNASTRRQHTLASTSYLFQHSMTEWKSCT
jgi:hypothetical protein